VRKDRVTVSRLADHAFECGVDRVAPRNCVESLGFVRGASLL